MKCQAPIANIGIARGDGGSLSHVTFLGSGKIEPTLKNLERGKVVGGKYEEFFLGKKFEGGDKYAVVE